MRKVSVQRVIRKWRLIQAIDLNQAQVVLGLPHRAIPVNPRPIVSNGPHVVGSSPPNAQETGRHRGRN
jgi:hypothetical protein